MDDYLLIAKTTLLELAIPVLLSAFFATCAGFLTARITLGRRRSARAIVFCNMFGLYGVVLGFFIGASTESIVRDAFSSVVTIASGYFAYLLSKDLNPRVKAMIPAAVICFLLSLIMSATFFAKLRQAYGAG